MAENVELEELDQLVNCPGWTRFRGMVEQLWGTETGGGSVYVSAISSAAQLGDADAIAQLRQIIAAQREIQKVMQLVPNRLQVIRRAAGGASEVVSRRGAL